MNENYNLSHDLHDLAQIEPSPDATQRAIARAQAALEAQPLEPITRHGGSLMRPRNLITFTAAAIALFLVTYWALSAGFGGIAFAQVQAQVEKTKSVQYVQTRRNITKDGNKSPVTEDRVMILGNIQRKESSEIEPGDKLPEGQSWGSLTEKTIDIYDPEKGKMLVLVPEKKGYSYITEIYALTEDNKIETEKVKPVKAAFYEMLRQVPSDKAKQLPAKAIDGTTAIGFLIEEKIERKSGIDTWKKTYWVDQKTKLPIRIETSFSSTNPMMGDCSWVTKDIIFDAPLDAALFSLDPPKGYTDLAKLEEQEEKKSNASATALVKALVFAEVVAAIQEEIAKAKSVQYTEAHVHKTADGKPITQPNGKPLPAYRNRVKILGDHLKRKERLYEPGDFASPLGPEVNIQDLAKGKVLFLFPEQKAFISSDFHGPRTLAEGLYSEKARAKAEADRNKAAEEERNGTKSAPKDADKSQDWDVSKPPAEAANKATKSTGTFKAMTGKTELKASEFDWKDLKPLPERDFFELVRNVPTENAQQLPENLVDGKPAIGFRVRKQDDRFGHGGAWQHTWWVDPETNRLLRLEVVYSDPRGVTEATISDIVFDAPLDASLFSVEPPADYVDLANMKTVQCVRTDRTTSSIAGKPVTNQTVQNIKMWRSALQRGWFIAKDGDKPDILANNFDAKTGKSITLWYNKSKFFRPAATVWDEVDAALFGIDQISELPKNQSFDFYDAFCRVPMEKATSLPEQTIDGKRAIGYVIEEELPKRKRTYWVDPTTKLPLRIEFVSEDATGKSSRKTVIEKIVYGAQLLPPMLATDPPGSDFTEIPESDAPKTSSLR